MINVLVIVMEGIAAWLCLHCAFGEKIKKSKGEIIFFLIYVVLFLIVNLFKCIELFGLLVFIYAVYWAIKYFNKGIKKSVFIIIGATVILAITEVMSMVIFEFFIEFDISMKFKVYLITLIALLITVGIYYVVFYRIKYIREKTHDKTFEICLIAIFLFLITVKIEFELNKKISFVFIVYSMVLILAFFVVYQKQKSIYRIKNDNINIELHKMYGKAYDDLLVEVRRKQHDYNNQLTAIMSMHTVANSLEELVKMQSSYIGMLDEEKKVDTILTKCNNSILAGYLYNTYIQYLNDGFDVEMDVIVMDDKINIKTKDEIEVLGILLCNAEEYVNENFLEDKIIKLYIREINDKIEIEVTNISKRITNEQIEKMFQYGVSSKSNKRGVGLCSLKTLSEKYNGDIFVENFLLNDTYWTKFKIVF